MPGVTAKHMGLGLRRYSTIPLVLSPGEQFHRGREEDRMVVLRQTWLCMYCRLAHIGTLTVLSESRHLSSNSYIAFTFFAKAAHIHAFTPSWLIGAPSHIDVCLSSFSGTCFEHNTAEHWCRFRACKYERVTVSPSVSRSQGMLIPSWTAFMAPCATLGPAGEIHAWHKHCDSHQVARCIVFVRPEHVSLLFE